MAQVERDKDCCEECTYYKYRGHGNKYGCIKHNCKVEYPMDSYCDSFSQFEFSLRGQLRKKERNTKNMCNCNNGTCKQKEDPELKNPFDTQVGGSHYKVPGVMDVTEWCMAHDLDIGEFNAIKYIFRHDKKNGIEDLRKAKHYLEMIAYTKYKENL